MPLDSLNGEGTATGDAQGAEQRTPLAGGAAWGHAGRLPGSSEAVPLALIEQRRWGGDGGRSPVAIATFGERAGHAGAAELLRCHWYEPWCEYLLKR